MPKMTDKQSMIANMAPVLQSGIFVFCSVINRDVAFEALSEARAMFVEDEGFSLILPRAEADRLGLSYDMRLRQITLMVFSALEGVGLTAAVAEALEKKGIPANIVAATLHDHVFVPSNRADEALQVLRDLQKAAQGAM
ncbi:ACT domain-containing protein [Alphaproteobacteria bacterium GH1-50]|uniref:ACT domain-containing protein n=1 Tax=Kangsaoukella pontilimi TaxID=2691042 RepID=A0A7C9MQ08_9RHOB|nr:ACT domain-containing protein [Kangsaoukella pontilimi]MXQ06937.1 ACT domain-containing protein [Kangsaoukella pontilimi]